MGSDPARAVIVLSSHVARGSVGNRAAVFALEALGLPVWAVPTVLLPWHPGHGPATRIVPEAHAFSAFLGDLGRAPWLGEVAAVLSGYLGDAGQAEGIASLVGSVKARNPKALYVCDPVIGDSGGLYVPKETVAALKDLLLPLADVATPNRYELEWFAGARLDTIEAAIATAAGFGPPTMLVTSAPSASGSTGNLLVTPSEALLAEHRFIERAPKGLGDLTSALFLARLIGGQAPEQALRSTTGAVFEILARTMGRGADELTLETDAESLRQPRALVKLRTLPHPEGNRRA